MGTRSKGRRRDGQVTTYSYKPRMGRMSKLARRIARAIRKDTYSRALETEVAHWWRRKKSRRTARGKRKVSQ